MKLDVLKSQNKPIFFVTNDPGRAIGLENILPNFHIVCLDDSPLFEIIKRAGISIFCLEREINEKNTLLRSSGMILEHPKTLSFIKEKSKNETPNILFFKPQKKIEVLSKKFGFNLIGNSTEQNLIFEDKINFFELFKTEDFFPQTEVFNLNSIDYSLLEKDFGSSFVIQFGSGWAGNSTFFIDSPENLMDIQKKFGNIKIKVSRFIEGVTVLNNAVVAGERVFQSFPAIQIKSNKLLTAKKGGTGGRQWPAKISSEQILRIKKITEKVGAVMGGKGYKGFFGLDFLIEEKTGKVFLSENNARLTASSPFYTKLELNEGGFPLLGCHLLSFLNPGFVFKDFDEPVEVLGSEIVVKNTNEFPVEIGNEFRTGIYDKNLLFKREEYFLNNANESEFWLTSVGLKRKVNPEIEMFRIDSFGEACDGKGNLNKEIIEIIGKINQSLKPQKC